MATATDSQLDAPAADPVPATKTMTAAEIAGDTLARWTWIVENLRIIDKAGVERPLAPNRGQQHIIAAIQAQEQAGLPVRIILLKARQFGGSTAIQADIFARCYLLRNRSAFTQAHEAEASANLFRMTKDYHALMPVEGRMPTAAANGYELAFAKPHGGRMRIATAGSPDAARSGTYQYAHLSEIPQWPDQDRALQAIMAAIPDKPGTAVFKESTAKGVGNRFHQDWKDACKAWQAGDMTWIPVFVGWLSIEEYQTAVPEWYDWAAAPDDVKEDEPALRRMGATPEQLYWRRRKIASDFGGNVDGYREEYPSCVAGNTRVSTPLGLLPIGELGRHGLNVGWYPKGRQETVRVTTSLGYEVEATTDHPIARGGLLDGRFSDAGKLVQGDTIVLRPPQFAKTEYVASWPILGSIAGSVAITEDWGRLLGYFMGDGSLYRDTIAFACNGDADVRADILDLMRRLLGLTGHERQLGKKNGNAWEIRVSSVAIKPVLRELGCLYERPSGGWMRKVSVPPCIWRSPAPVVRQFLRGLFESDGFNAYNTPNVKFFSKDARFAKDVQILLLGFGITCRYASVIKRAGDGHEYHGNDLALRKEEAIAFNERIGFVSARKRNRHDPAKIASVRSARGCGSSKNAIPMKMSDTVASVVPSGIQDVYDITVEPEHVFSANGILVHNCPDEAFITSGRPAIPAFWINHHRTTVQAGRKARLVIDKAAKCGVRAEYDEGLSEPFWRIWRPPIECGDYCGAGDVAEGRVSDMQNPASEPDRSVALFIERSNLEDVAEWIGRVEPDIFGMELLKAALWYNRAWVTPEVNPVGIASLLVLRRARYPRIMQRQLPPDVQTGEPRKQDGWLTTNANRENMISDLLRHLGPGPIGTYEGQMVVRSAAFLDECQTFIKTKTGRREHAPGQHDDCLFARGICLQVHLNTPRRRLEALRGGPVRQTMRSLARDMAVDMGPAFDGVAAGAYGVEEVR